MTTEQREEQTGLDVTAWQRDQLVHSGFPLPLASQVAHDRRYDLRALIELAEHGCPPELAVHMVAPLENGDDAA